MKTLTARNTAELIGMAAIVASLIFVGVQVNQAEEIATIEMLSAGSERQRDIARLIIENADVWRRGCVGDELSDVDATIFSQLFTQYMRHKNVGWQRLTASDFGDVDPKAVANSVALNMYVYPGFRAAKSVYDQWLAAHGSLSAGLNTKLEDQIRLRLNELERSNPKVSGDVALCGVY